MDSFNVEISLSTDQSTLGYFIYLFIIIFFFWGGGGVMTTGQWTNS